MMNLCFIDCETGGLDPLVNPLLTVHARLTSPTLVELQSFDLNVRSEGMIVNQQALAINKINLNEHDATAYDRDMASTILKSFLADCKRQSPDGLVVVGHFVEFDIGFLQQLIPTFKNGYARQVIDTRQLAHLGIVSGLIDSKSSSLQNIRQALQIQSGAKSHTAHGDVDVTVEVFRFFLDKMTSHTSPLQTDMSVERL